MRWVHENVLQGHLKRIQQCTHFQRRMLVGQKSSDDRRARVAGVVLGKLDDALVGELH